MQDVNDQPTRGGPLARGAPDLNAGATPQEGFRMAQESVRPGQASAMAGEQEATPEEQAEYERAMAALGAVLYDNEKTGDAIARQLTPEEKVGSVAKASLLVIKQLDDKLDLDEVVIPEFTQEVVDRIVDIYENVHQDEFTEQDAQHALGATWEGVMEIFGVDESSYAELTADMSKDDVSSMESQYKQFLGE